jgi:hypothetical protein
MKKLTLIWHGKIFLVSLLLIYNTGCIARNSTSFYDLYTLFNALWILFLVLGLSSGIYYIFGKDDKKRNNAGKASIVCLILFVALLITA